MKLGLQISAFNWPGGAAAIGPTLARIVRTARDEGALARLCVVTSQAVTVSPPIIGGDTSQ